MCGATESSANPSAAVESSDALVGQRPLGQYLVKERIGEGGFATVYLAEQLGLQRRVVLKVLKRELLDEVVARRFEQEGSLLAKLDHPNLVRLFAVGHLEDGRLFLAMEWGGNQTLADLISREGRLPLQRALSLAAQVADALGEVHRQGMVHRDVKPSNLLLGSRDAVDFVKLGDVGIAKFIDPTQDARLTRPGSVLGTPPYFSPEQAMGLPLNGRSDLYALGVVLFEMLSGALPFRATSSSGFARAHVQEQPERLAAYGLGIPPAVEALVARALEKDPSRRWTTAEEMGAALSEAQSPGTGRGRPKSQSLSEVAPSLAAAWQLAADEAKQMRAPCIEPEHLLLGALSVGKLLGKAIPGAPSLGFDLELARPDWETLVAALTLQGQDPATLRRAARARFTGRDSGFGTVSELKRSPASHAVFEAAEGLARFHGANTPGLPHLVAALLDGVPAVSAFLTQTGLRVPDLRLAVLPPLSLRDGHELTSELREVVDATVAPYSRRAGSSAGDEASRILYELPLLCAEHRDPMVLLQVVARRLASVFSDAPFISLLVPAKGSPTLTLAAHEPPGRVMTSLTLARRVFERKEAVVWTDGEPADAAASLAAHGNASAMYAPLVWRGEALGVVTVGSQKRARGFAQHDLALLVAVAHQLALALVQHRTNSELEGKSRVMERLLSNFSPNLRERLVQRASQGRLKLGGERSEVTVLFSDMRGFTNATQGQDAQDVVELLNDYFAVLVEAVFAHHGAVDKFIGDAVLAVFGSPEPDPEQHLHAVSAAQQMQASVALLNETRRGRGATVLEVGIGVHCGEVLHGFIGTPERMEFTVIGDTVNRASRLCSGAMPGEVLISGEVHQRVWRSVAVESREITTKHEGTLRVFRLGNS